MWAISSMRCIASLTKIMRNCMLLSSKRSILLTFVSSSCMAMALIDSSAPTYSKNFHQIMPYVRSIFRGAGRARGIWWHTAWRRSRTLVNLLIWRDCIISYLRLMSFKKFILWGRSMGATSSLLYCIKYQPEDVLLQVVDSPFYSF